jgi:cytochrome c
MVAAGKDGLVWTPDKLDTWLKKPKDVVAGTKMTFAGLTDQADVDNVIAYLQTFPAN